jgi:hypothetical protein
MELHEIGRQTLHEDDEVEISAVLNERKQIQVIFKGKKAEFLNKLGTRKAGMLGSLALDQTKRYKKFKSASNRAIAFYARNIQERRAYEKVVKSLTKSGEYRIARTFPYTGGARMWELVKK